MKRPYKSSKTWTMPRQKTFSKDRNLQLARKHYFVNYLYNCKRVAIKVIL